VPITTRHIPSLQIIVDLLGEKDSKAARAYTTHNINIPSSAHYALDVEVSPEDTVLR